MSKNARKTFEGFDPRQTFLFPVDQEIREKGESVWTTWSARAAKAQETKRQNRFKSFRAVVVQMKDQGLHWQNEERLDQLLEQPLGYYIPSELDVQPAPEPETDELPETSTKEVGDMDPCSWSDEAIIALAEGIILYSLKLLHSKGNAAEKKKILEWIWTDTVDHHEFKVFNNEFVPERIAPERVLFTFRACCKLSGYRYDELRAGLAWELREIFPKVGFAPKDI